MVAINLEPETPNPPASPPYYYYHPFWFHGLYYSYDGHTTNYIQPPLPFPFPLPYPLPLPPLPYPLPLPLPPLPYPHYPLPLPLPPPQPINHVVSDETSTNHSPQPKKRRKYNKPKTFRVYCKAKTDYSLAVYEGKVVLAPANPYDPLQHWIKDDNVGLNVKDEEGFPSFALINKATGQAIKHSIGVNYPVRLKKYNPDKLDKSVLWTMSKKLDDGYRAVSAVDNTHLKLDAAFRDIKKHDGVHDDAYIVLCDWHGGNNQRWTIISYYRLVRNLDV
ncbi:ricin B-like lectin R40G3 [Tanacetum coccineum]